VGWVVGHSFIVYGPLINRNSSIILKGNPKKPRCQYLWRIIDEHKVNAMFTAPTAIRAIRKEDPNGDFIKQYDLSSLKQF
jgi:propionyl-CoA synthetase